MTDKDNTVGSLFSASQLFRIFVAPFFFAAYVSFLHAEPAPFMHNGQPFFPIGIYHYPGGADHLHMQEISQAGFNLVRRNIDGITVANLDAAHSYGLNILANSYFWLGNIDTYGTQFEAKINEIKNHPAFFAYETYDEPYWNWHHFGRGYSREDLTAGREFANQRDPNHPVLCNFAPYDLTTVPAIDPDDNPLTFEGYQLWTSVGDIYGMDRYPVWFEYPYNNLSPVSFNCDKLQEIAGAGTTVYMVLQGVGMLEWDGDPNNDYERPNFIETRFMAYSSIIHGARGILYWGQYYIEPDSQLWTDLKACAGQLSYLHNVLCMGVTDGGFSILDDDCEAILKIHEGYRYLIVANRTLSTKTNVPISVTGWCAPTAEVLFESRSIDSNQGNFTDNFQPWDVHVYRNVPRSIHIDLGTTDDRQGVQRVVVGDGDTQPATIGGRDARRNVDPAADYYFYFEVNDLFAYQGSKPELFVMIDYYDTGSGSLGLQYDSSDTAPFPDDVYKNGGTVQMTGTNTWKQHFYHITDAYFGNLQNNGADFRIAKYGGGTFYLDIVTVSEETPLPGQAGDPDPTDQATNISLTADLSWSEAEKATSYHVYFGNTNPPPFQSNQMETYFDPGFMDPLTPYYWRIDTVNGFGVTTGVLWSFTTEPAPGDFDEDTDVDLEDFGYFQACLSGSGRPAKPGCEKADFNTDNDIDQDDFVLFRGCISGSGIPADPHCLD